jgi:hypothetical protein
MLQQLKQIYRENYAGENIVTNLHLVGGDWNPVTDYVENRVFNTYTTSQALVIGNGETRLNFDLTHIANHQGGLGGANRLQTYGCNALYRDFTPDFLVATGDDIVKEIVDAEYASNNIVYSTADNILKYPGKFYLVPQNPHFDSGSLAAYLACFDGHKKVFLMGFDQHHHDDPVNNVYKDTPGYPTSDTRLNNRFLSLTLSMVMSTYSEVEFIRVVNEPYYWVDDEISQLLNFRQITFREFVLEADIG